MQADVGSLGAVALVVLAVLLVLGRLGRSLGGLVRAAVLATGAVVGLAACAWLVGAALTVAHTPAWRGWPAPTGTPSAPPHGAQPPALPQPAVQAPSSTEAPPAAAGAARVGSGQDGPGQDGPVQDGPGQDGEALSADDGQRPAVAGGVLGVPGALAEAPTDPTEQLDHLLGGWSASPQPVDPVSAG